MELKEISEGVFDIKGSLDDNGGNSIIEGKILGPSITFTKRYISGLYNGQTAEHSFTKVELEEASFLEYWSGTWENGTMKGRATCSIVF